MEKIINVVSRKKKLVGFSLALMVFIFLSWLIVVILPGGSKILLTIEADHADKVQFYWWNGVNPRKFSEKESDESKQYQPHIKQVVLADAADNSLHSLRIDPGHLAGVYKIYSLEIHSHFSDPVVYSGSNLLSHFTPGKEGVSLAMKDNSVVVTADGGDPYIISTDQLQHLGVFYRFVIPLLFSLLFYIFFVKAETSFFDLAAFKDIDHKAPSSGYNINRLDGLRGLAALTVVADHSWGIFKGTGFSGVMIFFSLSGFLLAMPFVQNSSRALSFNYMVHYFKRRMIRILPIYYLIIIIYYCFEFELDIAIRHFLFLQGDGHFWAIPQEMLFYLLLPFFVITIHWIFKRNLFFTLSFLLLSLIVANVFVGQEVLALYGMIHQKIRAYIGVFLGGMFFSYLYFSNWFQELINSRRGNILSKSSGVVGLLLVVILIFFSNKQLLGGSFVYAQHYFKVYGFLAGVLVFCVAMARGTWLGWLMNLRLLRGLGVVSLSLYLIHPPIVYMLLEFFSDFIGIHLKGPSLFIATVFVSYPLACLSYSFIEKSPYNNAHTLRRESMERT